MKLTTAKQRLAIYRDYAAPFAAGAKPIAGVDSADWRTYAGASNWRTLSPVKISNPYNPDSGEHYGMGHCRWIENAEKAGLRFVGHPDEILPGEIRHTGWFTDSYQSETVRGGVWQLPSRRGEMLFVCGYSDPDNDGAAFISFDVVREDTSKLDPYDFESVENLEAVRDAARWGDSMAERMAEAEREYRAKDQAEQQIEEAREPMKTNDCYIVTGSIGPQFPPRIFSTMAKAKKYRSYILKKGRVENIWPPFDPVIEPRDQQEMTLRMKIDDWSIDGEPGKCD